MKYTLFTLSLIVIGFCANAQKLTESQAPANVMKTFKARYPSIHEAKWEKEDVNYESNFRINKLETSAIFDSEGNLIETETEIPKSSLPKAVSDAVVRDYADHKIEETAKIDKNGIITYEVEVEKGEKSFDLIYDEKGKFLTTTPVNEKKKRKNKEISA